MRPLWPPNSLGGHIWPSFELRRKERKKERRKFVSVGLASGKNLKLMNFSILYFSHFIAGRGGGAVSPQPDGGDHPDVGVLHLRQLRPGVQVPEGECPVPIGISTVNSRLLEE